MNEQELKQYQAQAAAELQKEISAAIAEQQRNPFESHKKLFLHELAQRRFKLRMSQSQLAAKAGMTQSEIARMESGKGNPSLQTLLRIAAALETSITLESAKL